MSVEGTRHKDAKLTGRRFETEGVPLLLELQCPYCQKPQCHPSGMSECIYCGKTMNVRLLTIVRKQEDENDSGNSAGA